MYFQLKLISSLLLVMFLSEPILAKRMAAKMMASMPLTTDIELTKIMTHFEKIKKIPDEQLDIYTLSKLAKNVFSVEKLAVPGTSTDPLRDLINQLSYSDFTSAITNETNSISFWNKTISKENKDLIKKENSLLKKYFHRLNPYTWSWILKQLGKADESKSILKEDFQNEYTSIMEKKRILLFGGDKYTPTHKINLLYETLAPLINSKEKSDLIEKKRKAKIHLSNLPTSKILT